MNKQEKKSQSGSKPLTSQDGRAAIDMGNTTAEATAERALAGKIEFSFELLDVHHQDDLFSDKPVPSTDFRAKAGLLLVNLQHLVGFDEKMEYGIGVELAQTADEASKLITREHQRTTNLSAHRIGHPSNKLCSIQADGGLQCQQKVHVVCDEIEASTLFIYVYRKQKKPDVFHKIGAFKCKLNNAHGLIDGQQRVYVLDDYVDYENPSPNASKGTG